MLMRGINRRPEERDSDGEELRLRKAEGRLPVPWQGGRRNVRCQDCQSPEEDSICERGGFRSSTRTLYKMCPSLQTRPPAVGPTPATCMVSMVTRFSAEVLQRRRFAETEFGRGLAKMERHRSGHRSVDFKVSLCTDPKLLPYGVLSCQTTIVDCFYENIFLRKHFLTGATR